MQKGSQSTTIHIGMMAAYSPDMPAKRLEAFGREIATRVAAVLDESTGVSWNFHTEDATRLKDDDARAPGAFVGEASLRMVEGPYDIIVVITDVALAARNERVVAGLASPTARIIVMSTRKLQLSPRDEPVRTLDSESVRVNGAALLLHLIGHVLGLRHVSPETEAVMSPFRFDASRQRLPPLDGLARSDFASRVHELPQRTSTEQGFLPELRFHVASAMRNPGQVARTVARSRAPLLPLQWPRLATAAVLPTFILVFTAEIWDAGFHMTNRGVWLFAIFSVLASTIYLVVAQRLMLPFRDKRHQVEHLAVVNVAIVCSTLLATTGLFVMLSALMLLIQVYIFPADLVREWPSLDLVAFDLVDQVRIAALISTIGVLSGALGGGLENRDVIRHVALFEREP